jgi:hypothetical protein
MLAVMSRKLLASNERAIRAHDCVVESGEFLHTCFLEAS